MAPQLAYYNRRTGSEVYVSSDPGMLPGEVVVTVTQGDTVASCELDSETLKALADGAILLKGWER